MTGVWTLWIDLNEILTNCIKTNSTYCMWLRREKKHFHFIQKILSRFHSILWKSNSCWKTCVTKRVKNHSRKCRIPLATRVLLDEQKSHERACTKSSNQQIHEHVMFLKDVWRRWYIIFGGVLKQWISDVFYCHLHSIVLLAIGYSGPNIWTSITIT